MSQRPTTRAFVDSYLTKPAPVNVDGDNDIQEILQSIENTKTEGRSFLMALLSRLLSKLSDQDADLICFVDSHLQPPLFHPRGHTVKPDLCAVFTSIWKKAGQWPLPWHHILSVVEWRTDLTDSQAVAYGGSHNLANPQNPTVLVLSACPNGYTIGYSDPSGYIQTPQTLWNNLPPLLAYLHSVQHPRCSIADTTVSLHNPFVFTTKPLWRINDPQVPVDSVFEIYKIGRTHSRMSTIFRNVQTNLRDGDVRIIKDAYPSVHQYVSENDLYGLLTEEGTRSAPGWVRTKLRKEVHGDQALRTHVGSIREKLRTPMLDNGEGLMAWESWSDALMGFYDMLEASRWAISKCGVMHRDLSANNVLVKPTTLSCPTEQDGAVFVKGVLSKDRTQPSQILLFDLDVGACLRESYSPKVSTASTMNPDVKQTQEESLRARTGTPMYMATLIIAGCFPDFMVNFPDMPAFHDGTLEALYSAAYGNDPLRMLSGSMGTIDQIAFSKRSDATVKNMSWHDAESAFWTLFIHMLRRLPKGSSIESRAELSEMSRIILDLRKTAPDRLDIRLDLLARKTLWVKIFHPKFAKVVQVLFEMATFITYCHYEFLSPVAGINSELVLHEAFQRIALRTLHGLQHGSLEDIQLDTMRLRQVYDDRGVAVRLTAVASSGLKRIKEAHLVLDGSV